jgi:hypothetical protein
MKYPYPALMYTSMSLTSFCADDASARSRLVSSSPSRVCVSIRSWNDTQITSLNPTLYMPNKGIFVVLQKEARTLTRVFTHASSLADAEFNATIGLQQLPPWPTNKYHGFVRVSGGSGPMSYVLSKPYSIAIATQGSCRCHALRTRRNCETVSVSYMLTHSDIASIDVCACRYM